MTITENHQIMYRNVASKYYNFYPEEIQTAFEDFQRLLIDQGYTPIGRFFFSIISNPAAEVMTAELFIPIEEEYFNDASESSIFFKSYFCINGMVMTRITDNFNENAQLSYWDLMSYVNENDLEQRTPIFVEHCTSHTGRIYIEMSVGAFL